jgi:hypothetical protein
MSWIYQMSDPSPFPEVIRQVFRPTERGLVGLVNDLLGLCQEVGLELDWRAGQCRVRSIGVEPEEYVEVQLPKSVFRAILARLAALCNQHNSGSVSPFGGEGELSLGVEPATVCRVAFTNSQAAQRVGITPIQQDGEEGGRQRPQQRGLDSDPRLRTSASR